MCVDFSQLSLANAIDSIVLFANPMMGRGVPNVDGTVLYMSHLVFLVKLLGLLRPPT